MVTAWRMKRLHEKLLKPTGSLNASGWTVKAEVIATALFLSD